MSMANQDQNSLLKQTIRQADQLSEAQPIFSQDLVVSQNEDDMKLFWSVQLAA